MSANDDYPYRLMGQRYQDMCDEIDHLRKINHENKLELEELRAVIVYLKDEIETYREIDDQAGKDIERLTAEVEGLKKAIALYKGDEF